MQPSSPIPFPAGSLSRAQRGWQARILLASYLAYAGYYLTRKTFAICKTTIATDLGWPLGDTAHIWTAYLVAYMLGMHPPVLRGVVGRLLLAAEPARGRGIAGDCRGCAGGAPCGARAFVRARGNWGLVCACMALGIIAGYGAVMFFGQNPAAVALWFGLVGFMLYGPDTLLCGAASVQVAGEENAVAVAGLVNGLGSVGPIVQEEVIGWLVRGDVQAGIRNTNRLALAMSILLLFLFAGIALRLHQLARSRNP